MKRIRQSPNLKNCSWKTIGLSRNRPSLLRWQRGTIAIHVRFRMDNLISILVLLDKNVLLCPLLALSLNCDSRYRTHAVHAFVWLSNRRSDAVVIISFT